MKAHLQRRNPKFPDGEHAALHCAVRGEEVHNGHNDEIAFGGLCSVRMPSANILAVASILAAISWHRTELAF
jgi:hypothetical protein